MYISEVYLKNFRSFEDKRFQLNEGLNTLVGANNAGKSNILDAIELVIGDTYLPNYEPNVDDFFSGDLSKELIVELTLKGDDIANLFSYGEQEVSIRYRILDSVKSFEKKINGEWIKGDRGPFQLYYDFHSQIFFLRVRSLRNVMEISPIRWKSPLKYLKEIILKKASEEKVEEVLQEIKNARDKLQEIVEVKSIIDDLEKITMDQIDISGISVSPASTKKSELINDIKVLVDDGYETDVMRKGFGTQNAVIIGLFRVMAKYIRESEKKVIIYGIDEPEIGLHPHGQRQLLKSLEGLATHTQVLITTHSNNLVTVSNADIIIRVEKKQNESDLHQLNLTPEERKVLDTHGRGIKELFFAKRAFVVEGDTEEGFFPQASRKISEFNEDFSFDLNSVTVINAEGNNIPYFLKIVKMLDIPHIAIIDDDKLTEEFAKSLKKCGIIKEEDFLSFIGADDDGKKKILLALNIMTEEIYETALTAAASRQTLLKIGEAINFVKENWEKSYSRIDFNSIEDTDKLRKEVFDMLKQNKKNRLGHVIADSLGFEEYPIEYIELIKKVAKLK